MLLKRPLFTPAISFTLLGTKMSLPIHLKVEFCRMLDRKDGAYGVVLCELFPPKKNKKIHQLVFKHETITKTKLTMEDWRKLFQKCNKLQEFLDVVKKHTGQDPWSKYKQV